MSATTQDLGEVVDLVFGELGFRGDAVTTYEGKPLYVEEVVPGERVRVRIRKRYRSMAVAEPLEILERSPDRVVPRCNLFGSCSGCQLQHITYPRQLALKQESVREHLRREGLGDVLVASTIGAEDPWHYRNHGRFTVVDGKLGFVRRRPRGFLEVPTCPIMDPAINEYLLRLSGRLPGATQCNIRVGSRTGEVVIQPKLAVEDVVSGQTVLHEVLCGRVFRVSAASFFQVHSAQAERLIGAVRDGLGAGPRDVIVDGHAGVGTFAAILAADVQKVIAIEESGPAIRDAQKNLEDLPNVDIRQGKIEDVLGNITEHVHGLIFDPPRSGCHPRALQAALTMAPQRIVYVSCEPETLVRDLKRLATSYEIEHVQPIDMFPHTRHVEVVAVLRLRAGKTTPAPDVGPR